MPRLALSGRVLMDQGQRLNEKIASGWERQLLLDILSAPFTDEIRTSPGAVVSHRISALPTTAYRAARWLPEPTAGDTLPAAPDGEHRRDSVAAAAWTWAEKHAQVEAAAAGRGVTRCCQGATASVSGWQKPGTTSAATISGGRCVKAAVALLCHRRSARRASHAQRARPTGRWSSAGRSGPGGAVPRTPGPGCERSGEVQTTTGLCFRCEVTAAAERKRVVDAEWAATVDQVKEAVVASENADTPY